MMEGTAIQTERVSSNPGCLNNHHEADGVVVNNTPIHSPDKEAHCALVYAEMQAVNRLKIAISQTDF